jgi:hypothetical protein
VPHVRVEPNGGAKPIENFVDVMLPEAPASGGLGVSLDGGVEPAERDRAAAVDEGSVVLRERLGPLGYLRYLRLTAGGRDDFQELRREWKGASLDEIVPSTKLKRGR